MESRTFYTSQVSNCDRRKLDLEKIRKYLTENGFREVDHPDNAELAILMSCITTGANLTESLSLIDNLNCRISPDAKIAIGGCLPKSHLQQYAGRTVLHFNPKDNFLELEKLIGGSRRISEISDSVSFEDSPNILNVRIQSGCLGSCTYCSIKDSIGKSVSKSLNQIIQETREGLAPEIDFIRLTGDDVGAYGFLEGFSITDVMIKLNPLLEDKRFIIDNLDPKYLVKFFNSFKQLSEVGKIFHLKLPVQHFNHRILTYMNRYSDLERVESAINSLTEDGVNIYTHFIVGFPSETRDELLNAVERISNLPIGQIAFIPYQNNPTAPSFHFPNQISIDELRDRMEILESVLPKKGQVTIPYFDKNTRIKEVRLRKEFYNDGSI